MSSINKPRGFHEHASKNREKYCEEIFDGGNAVVLRILPSSRILLNIATNTLSLKRNEAGV